jgi:hypothetical protein
MTPHFSTPRLPGIGFAIRARLLALCVALLASLLSRVAHAQAQHHRSFARHSSVQDEYVVSFGRHCIFTTRVKGAVDARATPDGEPYRVDYVPDLRVRAFVRCANLPALEWERALRGPPRSREALAVAVSRVALIRTRATGQTCLFAPTFAFDGARFTGTWLRSSCRLSPRASTEARARSRRSARRST